MWRPAKLHSGEHKYLAIADAIEEDVRRGNLHPGDRLPPQRELAYHLGITVGTVTRGYREAERRGLTRGETGRGTFVATDVHSPDFLSLREVDASDLVDLGLVFPLYSEDPDLGRALRTMSTRPAVQGLLQYQIGRGMARHRDAGALWVRRVGVEAHGDDVLICSGGQHALTILLGALCKPGERLLVEELTYPGIKHLATLFGIRLEPLPMDDEGVLPEGLEAACRRDGVRGLYTVPSMQNPTTATMSDARRAAIASLCAAHGLWIIEDDCYLMTLDNPPLPLYTYAPERTFFIASLSKTVAAGLRIAFLVAPREYLKRLESVITHTVWMASPILAELAAMWIEDGTALRVLRRKQAEARARNRIAASCLKDMRYRSKATGYFIWLEIPEAWTADDLQREALKRRVSLVSVTQFVVGNGPVPRGNRLSLSAAPSCHDLERGLTIVTEILSEPPDPLEMIL